MLTVSSRLGPYEILAPLGAGGMGEVYRACDTRLGREVAVKVLPEPFASDPERRARFEPAVEIAGHGRAAFALVANTDPYSYAGPLPVHVAPQARFELGLDLFAPRRMSVRSLARFLVYIGLGRGQASAPDVVYGHDLDRIEVVADEPMPLQADGEDLGDATQVVFEAERNAVLILV